MGILSSIFTKNPWKYLNDNSWTDDTTLRNLGIEVYQLIESVGISMLVLSMLVLVIKWMCSRREDRKNRLTGPLANKLIIAIVLGGFTYFVGLVWRIIDALAAQMIM